MTTRPGDHTSNSEAARARNVFQALVILIPASLLIAVLFAYTALRQGTWQVQVAAGIALFYPAVAIYSLTLYRRGRPDWAAQLLILGLGVELLGFTSVIAGSGLAMAVACAGLGLALGHSTLPWPTFMRTWQLAALLGAANLALDLALPPYRLVSTEIQYSLWIVLGLLVAIFGLLEVRQFRQYTLRNKLLAAFLAIALVPLAVQGLLNDWFARSSMSDIARQDLFKAATQTADSIDAFINTGMNTVSTEAKLPAFVQYLQLPPDQRSGTPQEAAAVATLHALVRDNPYISYALLDARGRDVIDAYELDMGLDKSNRDYFQEPLRTGLLYVSPVQSSKTLPTLMGLYFGGPVRSATGEFLGVLRVRYHAAILQRLVENSSLAGPRSFALLLDENHIRLAHSVAPELNFTTLVPLDPARLKELQQAGRLPDRPAEKLATNLPALDAALARVDVQPYLTTRLDVTGDEPAWAAVTRLRSRPWLVVVAEPQSAVLSPIQDQVRNTLLLAVVMALVVAGGARVVAQLLAGPITRLTEVTRQVMQGDLTAQARVESHDEIGLLADTFNNMTSQLRALITHLEQRVAERTHQLERRAVQIAAGAEVARAATTVLDPEELAGRVVELIQQRFDFYYVGLFLTDADNRFAVLKAGSGSLGRVMKERGHQLEVGGHSMVGWACQNKQARIALDVGQDAVRFNNPFLPGTRSEMALPLVAGDRVLGALDVQSTQVSAFDESDIATLQGMADQIAIALENARLFEQTQHVVRELDEANRLLARQGWQEYLDQVSQMQAEFRPEVTSAPTERTPAVLHVPLELRGERIGVLVIERAGGEPWTAPEIEAIEAIVQQTVLAADNARLLEQAQRRAANERMINEITARIRDSLTLEGVLNSATREIGQLTGVSYASIELELEPEP